MTGREETGRKLETVAEFRNGSADGGSCYSIPRGSLAPNYCRIGANAKLQDLMVKLLLFSFANLKSKIANLKSRGFALLLELLCNSLCEILF